MLKLMLQFLSLFLFIRSMIRLTQKINASASFAFSIASGSGHREARLGRAWHGTTALRFARELHIVFPCSLLTCGCQRCLQEDKVNQRVG